MGRALQISKLFLFCFAYYSGSIRLGKISTKQKDYLRTLINSDSLRRVGLNNYANMTSFIYVKVKGKSVDDFDWNYDNSNLPHQVFIPK